MGWYLILYSIVSLGTACGRKSLGEPYRATQPLPQEERISPVQSTMSAGGASRTKTKNNHVTADDDALTVAQHQHTEPRSLRRRTVVSQADGKELTYTTEHHYGADDQVHEPTGASRSSAKNSFLVVASSVQGQGRGREETSQLGRGLGGCGTESHKMSEKSMAATTLALCPCGACDPRHQASRCSNLLRDS